MCGRGDGSASVLAVGGTPPYSYEWNTTPVQTGPVATSLSGGTYTVTLTDSFCTVTDQVTVHNIPGPKADFVFNPNA